MTPKTYIENSICCDASTPGGNPGKVEYKIVDCKTKKVIYHSPLFSYGTNNLGEFLAICKSLEILVKNNDKRPVYSDSATAITWVRNKFVRSTIDAFKGSEIMLEVNNAITFLRENKIPNMVLKWETAEWGEIPADFGRK